MPKPIAFTPHSFATESIRSSVRIPALDGVRGIAVLLVLALHFGTGAASVGVTFLGLLKVTGLGWTGVDLFFVLSGFLITGILYDTRTKPRYFRDFYARRALRIFPIYFLCAAISFALIVLWPPMSATATGGMLYILTYTANVNIAVNGWLANPEILAHYWSLSVEEQFYLVWPLVVLYSSRLFLMRACIAMAAVALGLRIILAALDVSPVAVFVLTLTRFDSFAIGAFFALALRSPDGPARTTPWAAGALAIGLIGTLAVVAVTRKVSEYNPLMQTLGFTFISLASGALIVLAIVWQPLCAVISSSVLRWFGRYSYGLYIWHYLFYIVFFEIQVIKAWMQIDSKLEAFGYLLIPIALTVGTAFLSFHCFEQPFLRLKSRFS